MFKRKREEGGVWSEELESTEKEKEKERDVRQMFKNLKRSVVGHRNRKSRYT